MRDRAAVSATMMVALLSCAACSSTPPAGAAADATRDDCVFLRSVQNWQAVDDSSLLIWTGVNGPPHLVTLLRPAPSLTFAIDLAFEDANRDGLLCSFGRDALLLEDRAAGSYTIASIRKLDEAELGDLLSGHGGSKQRRPP